MPTIIHSVFPINHGANGFSVLTDREFEQKIDKLPINTVIESFCNTGQAYNVLFAIFFANNKNPRLIFEHAEIHQLIVDGIKKAYTNCQDEQLKEKLREAIYTAISKYPHNQASFEASERLLESAGVTLRLTPAPDHIKNMLSMFHNPHTTQLSGTTTNQGSPQAVDGSASPGVANALPSILKKGQGQKSKVLRFS